jgi:hypothetical protein
MVAAVVVAVPSRTVMVVPPLIIVVTPSLTIVGKCWRDQNC